MPSERYVEAVAYAHQLHATQVRKGSDVPYLSHLLSVSALVMEAGGNEDQAIAGLLHDGPEDCGGRAVLAEIESRFGPRVAGIVAACTDTFEEPKPPWRARKEAYVAGVPAKPAEALVVVMADKLHNARSILTDHAELGAAVWGRFRGGREGTAWYYAALGEALLARGEGSASLRRELRQAIEELVRRADADG
jgi:(p)ppGpp synthase/HD superfamily hydrolase